MKVFLERKNRSFLAYRFCEDDMKIFIADGSTLFCRQLSELFCELKGLEIVGQAQGAQQAFDAIGVLRPHVITLDIQMYGGSGIDWLRRIRQANSASVIIVLTNYSSPPYRKKCLQAGADFFFDKAIEINEVKRIIQDLLPRFNNVNA
jgi:DNA-binding NarL/FixJ family response regulator